MNELGTFEVTYSIPDTKGKSSEYTITIEIVQAEVSIDQPGTQDPTEDSTTNPDGNSGASEVWTDDPN